MMEHMADVQPTELYDPKEGPQTVDPEKRLAGVIQSTGLSSTGWVWECKLCDEGGNAAFSDGAHANLLNHISREHTTFVQGVGALGNTQAEPAVCLAGMGDKPYYLNSDQWDATRCRCRRPAGHDGEHHCGDPTHMDGTELPEALPEAQAAQDAAELADLREMGFPV